MSWLEVLAQELRDAGVPAGRRHRIVAELADHLACDPAAEARLGEPAMLARRFADEVGTVLARRAAIGAFAALVPLGALFAALFALTGLSSATVGLPVTVAVVLGVQLAFVGGGLAFVRAWRLRAAPVIPAAEAAILVRRAALGLAGGGVAVAGLAAFPSAGALIWTTVAVGAASIVAGSAVVARAVRTRPVAAGTAGDLGLDVGFGDPWRIAFAVACAVVLAIAVDGAVLGDPIDGLARGLADGLLCLGGFALLGRPLGLRR